MFSDGLTGFDHSVVALVEVVVIDSIEWNPLEVLALVVSYRLSSFWGEHDEPHVVVEHRIGASRSDVVNVEIDRRVDNFCLLYTSPSPRDKRQPRMPSSA